MKKACVFGCGRLGTIVARGLAAGKVRQTELAGIFGRTSKIAAALAAELGCPAAESLEELLSLRPDYVVEAATGIALRENARTILESGADLVALSVGAFSDAGFYTEIQETAERLDRHVYLAPGVVGGFDILTAARMMGNLEVSITKQKPPSASGLGDPALRDLSDYFSGTAAEAYHLFPNHLNVAVSIGLAAGSLEKTRAIVTTGELVSFTTEACGSFGKAFIYTELGTTGPDLAAWSALAVLDRLNQRIVL